MTVKGKPLRLENAGGFYPGYPPVPVPIGPSIIETWFRQGPRPKPLEIVLFYVLMIRAHEMGGWFPVAIKEVRYLFEFALDDKHVTFYLEQRKLVLPKEEPPCFDLLMLSRFFVQRRENLHEFDLTQELVSTLVSSGNIDQEEGD